MKILVTGASGYIGGRLIPQLLERGHEVRCMTRDRRKLAADPWTDRVEVVEGDALSPEELRGALDGCDSAFYLIHSMEDGGHDFSERDRVAAINFREAAGEANLRRIVYLGGLGTGTSMSKHLTSRQEVGAILADGPTPVTELRAAVIIGSGSVSFEMLRYLTEVLPVMITPTWVRTECQPIAIGDVLEVLVSAIESDDDEDRIIEIGGPDQMTYEEMMRIYAEEAGLPRRLIVPVPVLSPRLSSHWIGLVTPLPTSVAKPLVESLRVEVTVTDNSFAETVAAPLTPFRQAVARALRSSKGMKVATRWSDASSMPAQPMSGDPSWSGGTVLVDEKTIMTEASPQDLFWAFSRLGGSTGYYTMNWAWSVRGLLDALVGGVGVRRGRRDPVDIQIGEALDFWRVVAIEPGQSMQLHAEMRLPGEAWLDFEANAVSRGSVLVQRAVFVPRGLFGRLYWWILFPFHAAIFRRMATKIASAAEGRASRESRAPATPRGELVSTEE